MLLTGCLPNIKILTLHSFISSMQELVRVCNVEYYHDESLRLIGVKVKINKPAVMLPAR